jgi:hypothetical protein
VALNLFPSKGDALEFLENQDLDEARVELLTDMGRIRDAAGVHAKNGNMLKAVELLNAPATYNADYVRPTIEYLLTGLRRALTIGVLPISSPIASKLLVRADRLDKSAMTKQEVNEVSASRSFNWRALDTLAPPVCDVRSDPT